MGKYRILSIDGGGIRGLVAVVMLQRIAAEPGVEGFLDSIDLVAGTSTGGLLALGIADYQCRQLLGDRYHRLAPVFPAGVAVALDAVDRMDYMVEFAEGVDISASLAWLGKYWRG